MNAAPSAIGVCADPKTRGLAAPRDVVRAAAFASGLRNGITRSRWSKTLKLVRDSMIANTATTAPPPTSDPQQELDLLERPDDADDQVEDDHEAEEERQLLRHLGVHVEPGDPGLVEDHGAERRGDEEEQRRLEAAGPKAHAGVDEQSAPATSPRSPPRRAGTARARTAGAPPSEYRLIGMKQDHEDRSRRAARARRAAPGTRPRTGRGSRAAGTTCIGSIPAMTVRRQDAERPEHDARREDRPAVRSAYENAAHRSETTRSGGTASTASTRGACGSGRPDPGRRGRAGACSRG